MKVAISGGGIAGLSIAAVLAKRGHTVRVFERSKGESLGAGVVCFPNATLILRHFGLEERLRGVAGTPLTMRRSSREGDPLGDLPISTINELVGAPSYSVLRADLHRLLFDFALESGVEIETSCQVAGASGEGILHLSDGRHVAADWVIGADGRMDSPLRRYVVGENRPRYGGFVNWIGVAESDEDVFDAHVVHDYWGGFFAIRTDGVVLSATWDAPESVRGLKRILESGTPSFTSHLDFIPPSRRSNQNARPPTSIARIAAARADFDSTTKWCPTSCATVGASVGCPAPPRIPTEWLLEQLSLP